ncbi:hypothetical protein GPECTOR_10g774 [Gonium pectorale]|uniref:Cytosine-specific methyltransferase n=1 Tax=Gonium pectorale TaxID=33097 RepID=A0A150GQP1_GONPE|nr:hypothetical protein GPECTOR_10g774 [Gonium pectorale]|eukprot:KXZ52145.1 hypothetical protein GPECTOR_10g774 [Gonium pectorale]
MPFAEVARIWEPYLRGEVNSAQGTVGPTADTSDPAAIPSTAVWSVGDVRSTEPASGGGVLILYKRATRVIPDSRHPPLLLYPGTLVRLLAEPPLPAASGARRAVASDNRPPPPATPKSPLATTASENGVNSVSSPDRGDEGTASPEADSPTASAGCNLAAASAVSAAGAASSTPMQRVYAMVQAIFREGGQESELRIQFRRMLPGFDTVLRDAAHPLELYLLDTSERPGGGYLRPHAGMAGAPARLEGLFSLPLSGPLVAEVLDAEFIGDRQCGHNSRQDMEAVAELRAQRIAEREASGQPPQYTYRHAYYPRQGRFGVLRLADLGLGSYVREGDFLLLDPEALGDRHLALGGVASDTDEEGEEGRSGEPVDKTGNADEGDDKESGHEEDSSDSEAEDGAEDDQEEESALQLDGSDDGKGDSSGDGSGDGLGGCEGGSSDASSAAPAVDGTLQPAAAAIGSAGPTVAAEAVNTASAAVAAAPPPTRPRQKKAPVRVIAPRRPWVVGQLIAVRAAAETFGQPAAAQDNAAETGAGQQQPAATTGTAAASSKPVHKAAAKAPAAPKLELRVRLLARPEDVLRGADLVRRFGYDWADLLAPVSWEAAAAADEGDSGFSAWLRTVPVAAVHGSCTVLLGSGAAGRRDGLFRVVGSFDPAHPGEVGPLPASLELRADGVEAAAHQALTAEQAGPPPALSQPTSVPGTPAPAPLVTMDLFAGAGGLSWGLSKAGAADPLWAVELSPDASDAYRGNHPGAEVLSVDCNALLKAAMDRDLLEGSDCVATPECAAAAAGLDPRLVAGLPRPGEVEAIVGGPPCPGFSTANRARGNKNSNVKNSLIMSFMSFVDYYRPNLVLMENVVGFHRPLELRPAASTAAPRHCTRSLLADRNPYFRLALGTLLEMGYEVRFGVLCAAHYGAPQDRHRVFLLAARPDSGARLPDWPAPLHALSRPPPGIPIPGGMYYATAPQRGAPYRALTIWDAIGDLPEVENGASTREVAYTGEPISPYQREMREGAGPTVRDHEADMLTPEELELVKHIAPDRDWLSLLGGAHEGLLDPKWLEAERAQAAEAARRGLARKPCYMQGIYGRRRYDTHFRTITTKAKPKEKAPWVVHPEQHRLLTARERARAQSMPDTFCLAGDDLPKRNTQVGNAVPPKLAEALGSELRRVAQQSRRHPRIRMSSSLGLVGKRSSPSKGRKKGDRRQ